MGPIFKGQAVQEEGGTDTQSRNVRFKPTYVRNIPEDGRILVQR